MIDNINISYAKETNLSLIGEDIEIWDGKLPFKPGDKFPSGKLQARINKLKTAELLFENKADEIYTSLLSIFPEIDPLTGWQVRELISNLPLFKNSIDSWVGILCSNLPSIDFNSDQLDAKVGSLINESNFDEFINTEIANRFINDIGVYKIGYDLNGKPEILYIEPKNVLFYMNKEHYNSVEVTVIYNVYTKDNNKYIEFIEYHYNGKIVKSVINYVDGEIGREIEELHQEEYWIDESVGLSPIVIFKHNCIGNKLLGTCMFEYWSPSLVTAMRALQNLFRLGERNREMIRKVPEGAIKTDGRTGGSMFMNRGTISYPDGIEKSPDVEYLIPDVPIDKAIETLDKAIKNVSIDTKLGPVFFDIEKLGTNLSAKSIEAAMYPTKIEGYRIMSEVKNSLIDVIIRLACLANIKIQSSDFSIDWEDGFPKDTKEYTEAIQSRLGGKQSISLDEAIRKLDHVSSKEALIKAKYLQGISDSIIKNSNNTMLETNDISVVTENSNSSVNNEITDDKLNSNTLWETQMYPPPNDISISRKELKERWLQKLRRNH
jgi:hypothetical protein